MNNKEPNFKDMKKSVEKAGGLFYQYRPCRRDVATIYDIENIRHGVVYAQTPLNMNDPFDSMIGYSPEKMYEDCISLLMDAVKIDDENTRLIVEMLLKHKALGTVAELLFNLNELKRYIFMQRLIMHKTQLPMVVFVQQNLKALYSKSPSSVKKAFTKETFLLFALLVIPMEKVDITEQTLNDILQLNNLLERLHTTAIEIKDSTYLPHIRKFLSQLTVSCFSVSGWDNQLMWSHYANSYAGICIEYDFNKIEEFVGFIYPVNYVKERPTLSMKDIGIKGLVSNEETQIDYGEVDMAAIFNYMLAKNKCWEYESEWRIINVGKENTPIFVNLPYVKSITLGFKIDPICKHLLWDVCKERGIECYEILVDTSDFGLTRKLLKEDDFVYDADIEAEYIILLVEQINKMSEHMGICGDEFSTKVANSDFSLLKPMLSDGIDMLANSYFLKTSLNRLCEKSEEEITKDIIPESVYDIVNELNAIIPQIEEATNVLTETLPGLRLGRALGKNDYDIVNKHLVDLKELVERIKSVAWHPIYVDDTN
ncbi:MAG: DUF2971 domain-containing protein [Agathobacter sp.]